MSDLSALTIKIQAALDAHADYEPLKEQPYMQHKPDCGCSLCESWALHSGKALSTLGDEVEDAR